MHKHKYEWIHSLFKAYFKFKVRCNNHCNAVEIKYISKGTLKYRLAY